MVSEIKKLNFLHIGFMTEEQITIPAVNISELAIFDVTTKYTMVGSNHKIKKEKETDQFHIGVRSFKNSTSTYYVKEREELTEELYVMNRVMNIGRDIERLILEYDDGSLIELEVSWKIGDNEHTFENELPTHRRQYATIDENDRPDDDSPEDFLIGQTLKEILNQ